MSAQSQLSLSQSEWRVTAIASDWDRLVTALRSMRVGSTRESQHSCREVISSLVPLVTRVFPLSTQGCIDRIPFSLDRALKQDMRTFLCSELRVEGDAHEHMKRVAMETHPLIWSLIQSMAEGDLPTMRSRARRVVEELDIASEHLLDAALETHHGARPGAIEDVRELIERLSARTADRYRTYLNPALMKATTWTPEQVRRLQREFSAGEGPRNELDAWDTLARRTVIRENVIDPPSFRQRQDEDGYAAEGDEDPGAFWTHELWGHTRPIEWTVPPFDEDIEMASDTSTDAGPDPYKIQDTKARWEAREAALVEGRSLWFRAIEDYHQSLGLGPEAAQNSQALCMRGAARLVATKRIVDEATLLLANDVGITDVATFRRTLAQLEAGQVHAIDCSKGASPTAEKRCLGGCRSYSRTRYRQLGSTISLPRYMDKKLVWNVYKITAALTDRLESRAGLIGEATVRAFFSLDPVAGPTEANQAAISDLQSDVWSKIVEPLSYRHWRQARMAYRVHGADPGATLTHEAFGQQRPKDWPTTPADELSI